MFSGLIQTTGILLNQPGRALRLKAPLKKVKIGDSISVNGVCLTVVKKNGKNRYAFDLSPETLEKTTLSKLKKSQTVNIESALKASDSLGGHIVQGHVDGVGRFVKRARDMMWFELPARLSSYLVSKGSIAVDGISLTVASIQGRHFSVAVIPYTFKHTNLGSLRIGEPVNIEIDIFAKYAMEYTKHR